MRDLLSVPIRQMSRPEIIERAYQLAEQCASIEEIARILDKEGYSAVHDHLISRTLRSHLSKMIRESQAGRVTE